MGYEQWKRFEKLPFGIGDTIYWGDHVFIGGEHRVYNLRVSRFWGNPVEGCPRYVKGADLPDLYANVTRTIMAAIDSKGPEPDSAAPGGPRRMIPVLELTDDPLVPAEAGVA